ncbi:MAG: M48 family metallopeptidase [Roseburia sp.]|nr:M48 family metallopeptidase [Roseburia sp.]
MRERTYQLMIDGVTITVTKKRMKNMYLRIKKEDGSVRISAPHQMSDARIEGFARERIEWIRTYQQKYANAKRQRAADRELDPAEIKRRKQILKKQVELLVAKWEPVMGVSVSGITIRQMKTRWGSCNVKTHHININLALLYKPKECLEYVVVHEMTHILEASHNEVFWGYMTQFYPDWKRVRKYLNDEVVT